MPGFNTMTGDPYTPEDCITTVKSLYDLGHITLGELQSLVHFLEFHVGSEYPTDNLHQHPWNTRNTRNKV